MQLIITAWANQMLMPGCGSGLFSSCTQINSRG